MKIGLFHKDSFPLNEGSSVQSWKIFSYLKRDHEIYSYKSPFPGVKNISNLSNVFSTIMQLDCIFIIIDGTFNLKTEVFSIIPFLLRKKIPVIWLINAPIWESLVLSWYKKYWFIPEFIMRKLLSLFVTRVITVSDEVFNYANKDLKLKNISIVPNGTDPILYRRIKHTRELAKYANSYKVIWAGNGVYQWQGVDVIVEIARKMEKIDKTVVFILISNHFWFPIPKLRNLKIIPAVSYKRLPEYLSVADICLCLYHFNYFNTFYNSPMKLFDYMSMSKAIIATNIGQIKQVIKNNANGLLVENNVTEIISKILYLKNNPKIGKQLGYQARKDVINFYNWNRVGQQISKIIEEVVKR